MKEFLMDGRACVPAIKSINSPPALRSVPGQAENSTHGVFAQVQRRQDDIEQAVADFVSVMADEDGAIDEIDDVLMECLILDLEKVLDDYGIDVRHPVVVEDTAGNISVSNNI